MKTLTANILELGDVTTRPDIVQLMDVATTAYSYETHNGIVLMQDASVTDSTT